MKAGRCKEKARIDGMMVLMLGAMALAIGCSMMLRAMGGPTPDAMDGNVLTNYRTIQPHPAAHQVRIVTRD